MCIEDTLYEYNGLRILGLGGSMRYNRGAHQYTARQMRRRVDRLRFKLWLNGGFDILLTHAPAFNLGDDEDRAHRGFATFLRVIDKYQPQLFVHGHVHQSYRYDFKRLRTRGNTQVINACGSYIIDIPAGVPTVPPR